MRSNTSVKMFCVLLSLLLLSGCIPRSIVDEVSLMHNVGFDREKGMIKASVIFPNYTEINKPTLITAYAKNTSSLKGKLAAKIQSHLEMGQVRVMLLSEKLSKSGISQLLDSVCKDPKIGVIRIAVSRGSLDKILETSLKESPVYLKNLIDNSIENGGIPNIDLHTMFDQHYGSGIDMYFPTLNLDPKGKIFVDGIAIFKKDKFQYMISDKEALLLKFMSDRNKNGKYEFNLNMNGHKTNFGFETLYGNHNKHIIRNKNIEKVKLNLVLNIRIEELPEWIDLQNKSDFNSLRNNIQYSISREAEQLLESFQKNKVDPLGIGRIYRIKQKGWTENNFYQNIYPKLNFEVQTKIIFRQVGVGK